jgi:hypothetical protein
MHVYIPALHISDFRLHKVNENGLKRVRNKCNNKDTNEFQVIAASCDSLFSHLTCLYHTHIYVYIYRSACTCV